MNRTDSDAISILNQAATKNWPMAERHLLEAIELAARVASNPGESSRDRLKAATLMANVAGRFASMLSESAKLQKCDEIATAVFPQEPQGIPPEIESMLSQLESEAGE